MNIEKLYNSIAPRLTNWLVASGSSYPEACDLVQNVFLKLWKMKEDLIDDESAVSGLAFTMARNLRKNYVRDNARLTLVSEIRDADDGDGVSHADEGASVVFSPSTAPRNELLPSDAEYLRSRLLKAFAKLPPVLREAFTLFQVGDMSIREIANHTGVSESLVKVRIFRAKEKLKTILSDLYVT